MNPITTCNLWYIETPFSCKCLLDFNFKKLRISGCLFEASVQERTNCRYEGAVYIFITTATFSLVLKELNGSKSFLWSRTLCTFSVQTLAICFHITLEDPSIIMKHIFPQEFCLTSNVAESSEHVPFFLLPKHRDSKTIRPQNKLNFNDCLTNICWIIQLRNVAGTRSRVFAVVIVYLNCKWVFTRWQWYYNKTQHTNNTHHTK
jgi:hypothetical protein